MHVQDSSTAFEALTLQQLQQLYVGLRDVLLAQGTQGGQLLEGKGASGGGGGVRQPPKGAGNVTSLGGGLLAGLWRGLAGTAAGSRRHEA